MWFILIVGALIITGSILYAIFSDLGDGTDVLLGVLLALAVTIAMFMVSISFGQTLPADKVTSIDKTPIVALKDNKNETGHFFLGGGHVKSNLYYYYFTEDENQGKEFHQIEADDIVIYDDEKENPYIETRYIENSNPIINFFVITSRSETSIHIPEGSIDYSFSVNLE